ncbi:MAG: enoyl-CoA hydratase/isomerase family protein [Pirellulales bacterium]
MAPESRPDDPGRIDVRVHAPAGTIVLNRPGRCNALSRQMLNDLLQALDDLHLQNNVRAVILTGAGAHFSSGLDLSEIRESAQTDTAMTTWYRDAQIWRDVVEKILRFPKPVIAAVNGPALSAGAGLVLAADLAIGCREAAIGLPEPQRGLVAGVASPLLVFRLGAAVASQLLLTAQPMSAERLYDLGLYHELTQMEKIWASAHALSQQIAQLAPGSLLLTKRLLNETIGEQLLTWLSVGASTSATARTTDSAAEGVAAFLEKRPPKW